MTNAQKQLNEYKNIIETSLGEYVPNHHPKEIWDSMRYSLLAGGKRLRPILTLEACRLFSGDYKKAIPAACAIEMLHTQSLIHDDLPCMDNDDLRRGKPTNHKAFSESTAVLAGDALLTLAPQIIIKHAEDIPPESLIKIIDEYCHAAGAFGIIAGQVCDIQAEKKQITNAELTFIHAHKTGMLFRCALRIGAIIGNAGAKQLATISDFADKLGLAFQIADDILDEISTTQEMGKTTGKDKKAQKSTYVSLYGLQESIQKVEELISASYDIMLKNGLNSILFETILQSILEGTKRK